MNRFFVIALLVGASVCSLRAQVVDTTVCDILKAPQTFDGKTVRIKGTVVAGYDQFIIQGSSCGKAVNAIWLAYPERAKAKAGPAVVVELEPAHNFGGTFAPKTRAYVVLQKDKLFKQFDSALSTLYSRGTDMCLGCIKQEVDATLVGRLDGVANAGIQSDATGKITSIDGFGNMNAYPARLVIQSVSDVTPKPIDYSKAEVGPPPSSAPSLGPPPYEDLAFDPIVAALKSANAVAAGSPGRARMDHAVSALPKRGEHNGVMLINGTTNEAQQRFEDQSPQDSPDGVVYNCLINQDLLHNDNTAVIRSYIHTGELIADVRKPMENEDVSNLYGREYQAWAITVLVAISNGQKTLALPGGYLIWNSAWTGEDRTVKLDEGLSGYLTNEQMLTK